MNIGIITQYSNSINYGGNLQAYALCYYLNKIGYNAEQILLKGKKNKIELQRNITSGRKIKDKVGRLFNGLYKRIYNENFDTRKKAFEFFNKNIIKHSREYYSDCLEECCDYYDLFITGSDQVWNTDWYNPIYFLEFVKNKPKFSYAASIGKSELTTDECEIFKNSLKDFCGISVREPQSVDLLKKCGFNNVDYHIDPTLLLDRQEWDEICADRIVEESYCLGFFLSGDESFRVKAKKYSAHKKLKYIEVPCYYYDFHRKKNMYYNIGPREFISLIKYSDCVFTDSFHATVFSIIYNRQFFTFYRKDFPDMKIRLDALKLLFNCQQYFIDDVSKYDVNYFLLAKPNNSYMSNNFYLEKNKSMAYLKRVGEFV